MEESEVSRLSMEVLASLSVKIVTSTNEYLTEVQEGSTSNSSGKAGQP